MFYQIPESGTRQKLVPDCMTPAPENWYQFLVPVSGLSMSWALCYWWCYLGGTKNGSCIRLTVVTNHATTRLMHCNQLHTLQPTTPLVTSTSLSNSYRLHQQSLP